MRTGKELILATKPFAEERRLKSWWCLLSTLVVLGLFLAAACFSPLWYVSIPCSVFTGLVLVRLFVIYHDFMHGAILKNSLVAKGILYFYGFAALSPPSIWKHSHNDHHKNNAKSFGPALGSFPLMTTEEYRKASFADRLNYRIVRHPVTIMFGYLTAFFWAMSLNHFLRNPRRNYMAGLAVLTHVSVGIVLFSISTQALVLGLLIPMFIAGGLGSYLFYAQHNFPGLKMQVDHDWDYVFAALYSSSFMKMWKIMHWFTGNIGYHHVHHLNSKIPFYRLHEAMTSIVELQSNVGTSLHPVEIARCLRLSLWDPHSNRMLSFAEARTGRPVNKPGSLSND